MLAVFEAYAQAVVVERKIVEVPRLRDAGHDTRGGVARVADLLFDDAGIVVDATVDELDALERLKSANSPSALQRNQTQKSMV
jgi:hypothetical protein